MENTGNKNVWIAVGVIVLVVGGLIWSMKSSTVVPAGDNSQVVDNGDSTPGVDYTNTTTTGSTATSPKTGTAVSIRYANALIKYKDARLQLDKNCQASPDKMTFKNGSYMMVDNRAPVSRTVKLGSVFILPAYGFKIVQLSSATLPATWLVDCDKSQNVATITIQK